MVSICTPVEPFKVLRYSLDDGSDDGSIKVFGKVRFFEETFLEMVKIDITRGVEVDMNERNSSSTCLYIINNDGQKVEICGTFVKFDEFDNVDELKHQYEEAIEVIDDFNYRECDIKPEEWTVALSLATTVL